MKFLSFLLFAFLLVACGGNQEPTPAPVAAAPTNTPAPTATLIPTGTPAPTDTPTAAPTETPTPEPTHTPTALPRPLAEVIAPRINLRGGPGTNYPVVGKAARGERLTVLTRTEDGEWLEVELEGGERVWVAASLVQLSAPAETLALASNIPPTPPAPTVTPVPPPKVRLLLAYSPGCPHCAYQRPIIADLAIAHPEVIVTRVEYSELNAAQRRLIAGTSGHPIMVFYSDSSNDIRQIVGETPLNEMETEYQSFQRQMAKPGSSTTTTGSFVI